MSERDRAGRKGGSQRLHLPVQGLGDVARAAVVDISENLGVAIGDVYAFGDGVNDISMLKAAGTGVALGNALPEVREAADYVTSDIDKDGVARALAHFGLA